MKMISALFYLFFFLPTLFCCEQEGPLMQAPIEQLLIFDTIPSSRPVVPMIRETSGIADSKRNAGALWAHEDSDTPPQLFLLGHDGKVKKKIFLKDTYNRDWEEMALSGEDLFVADIGDNRQIYPSYTIYQFAEPLASADTVRDIKKIEFKYPDGSHDAEAFLVDPQSKDIYIITKRDNPSRLYKLTAPYTYSGINTLSYVGELPYTQIVGAALSANGKEVVLKTYTNLYYYTLSAKETLPQALLKAGKKLPYQIESQGEAITFTNANTGFFTLSEKGFSNGVNLNFYKRR